MPSSVIDIPITVGSRVNYTGANYPSLRGLVGQVTNIHCAGRIATVNYGALTDLNADWVLPLEALVIAPGSRDAAEVEHTSPDPTAFKADGGKPNWFLLMSASGCAKALAGVVRVLSFAVRSKALGGKGYVEHSWRLVPQAHERYEAALYRHLNAVHSGELVDSESGESHWYHIATNALFLAELHNPENVKP